MVFFFGGFVVGWVELEEVGDGYVGYTLTS